MMQRRFAGISETGKPFSMVTVLGVVLGAALLAGCSTLNALSQGGKTVGHRPWAGDTTGQIYTAYNIWYEKPQALSSINYQSGIVIPAGSKVRDIRVAGREINFILEDGNTPFKVRYEPKFHPGRTVEDIRDRMFTVQPLAARIKDFADLEKKCIQDHALRPGLSRAAVLVVCGYPPEHVNTPAGKSWMYWRNRWAKILIDFDENDKVTHVVGGRE